MVVSIGAVAAPAQGASYYERDGYYAKDDPAHREASAWAGKGALRTWGYRVLSTRTSSRRCWKAKCRVDRSWAVPARTAASTTGPGATSPSRPPSPSLWQRSWEAMRA